MKGQHIQQKSESIWQTTELVEVKDTHKEKAPPNKIPSLTNSTYMAIWVVDTSNQFFISGP